MKTFRRLSAIRAVPGHDAASVSGVTLAGKTGTAEIKESQEDTEGTELGWFAVYNTGALR